MSDDARRRWQDCHGAAGCGDPGTSPRAPELLAAHVDQVPTAGCALDVACGRGRHAVWLADRGLRVDAVDIAASGLDAGARLAEACGVADRVRWIEHDLDTGLPPGCRGGYDVVVCHRFRDPSLYGPLAEALAPAGLLAVTVLSEVGAGAGRFRAPPGELRTAFATLQTLRSTERDGQAALLARRPS